jgi:hypothetical protein
MRLILGRRSVLAEAPLKQPALRLIRKDCPRLAAFQLLKRELKVATAKNSGSHVEETGHSGLLQAISVEPIQPKSYP